MRAHVHTHFLSAADPVVTTSRRATQAVLRSFAVLCLTAVVQAAVAWYSGSVALLADTVHNAADASTALPLWIAFRFARRRPDQRFTYGYGRVEDLAGVIIVVLILLSAVAAGAESIRRFAAPVPVSALGAVAAAAFAGSLGNEAVARYRIRVGKEIGSAALVADGRHARVDGLTSLAVLLGAAGVSLGYPAADPLVGLLISAAILKIVWGTGREVFLRLLDGTDPETVSEIREAAGGAPGVKEVTEVRVRWSGHRMYGEVNLAIDGSLPVSEGHSIATEARHRLMHRLPYLTDATIHVDPVDASGIASHKVASHNHDDLPDHSH
ncbi:MAG: cation transporter [Deltaproteobacteria bacterium]|nr:cation transporter [Deltaproteobacteria bacterium]